jgi:hypothetical protein
VLLAPTYRQKAPKRLFLRSTGGQHPSTRMAVDFTLPYLFDLLGRRNRIKKLGQACCNVSALNDWETHVNAIAKLLDGWI